MSDGSRYADAAFQELLQSVPEARFIERQDACASGWPDRSSVDAQGTANLQCCHHFKDHVGSTKITPKTDFRIENCWSFASIAGSVRASLSLIFRPRTLGRPKPG